MKVLFFLRRIGPYHHARFGALARKVELTTVETRPESQEYPWEFKTDSIYQRILFPVVENPEAGLRGKTLKEFVRRLIIDQQPAVIITTGWKDPEYNAAVLVASSFKIPSIVISDNRYDAKPRKFYLEWIKKLLVKGYDAALVAGTESRHYMHGLGFPDMRIFQPWDVVDNSYFYGSGSGATYDERFILCVSRFIPEKNIPVLIDAFAGYVRAGGMKKLVMLGSGEGEKSLKEQLQALEITDRVDLKGFVQYEDLPGYFAKSLCLILPSISDQWGLVVNEAMAAGLPVLVSSLCGCAVDLVKPGINGYTFNPLNADEIMEKLSLMEHKTENEWKTMSTAALNEIKHWDLAAFAEGVENACSYALENPRFGIFAPVHLLLSR